MSLFTVFQLHVALNFYFFKDRGRFQDLPLEILSRIASFLSFLDLISFRQTSRKLWDATEARSLWVTLVAEYCTRQLNYLRPPTGGSTTEELRKWVKDHYIVDEIWKKPIARPRSVELTRYRSHSAVAIVPGGRWALLGNHYGYIHAYDLHREHPKPLLLIRPKRGDIATRQEVRSIAVSVDLHSPVLRFTVAFTGPGVRRFSGRLNILQVQLGSDGALSVQEQLSLPCSESFLGLSLSDSLVARTSDFMDWNGWTPPSTWAECFWWKDCSKTHIKKSTIRMNCQAKFTQVIGDDRLLCVDPCKGLHIYDIPKPVTKQFEQRLFYDDNSTPARDHTWFYSLEGYDHKGYSRLYFDGVHYRQAISISHSIFGLVVPASERELPYLLKLADQPPERPIFYGLGLHKGYATLNGGGARYGYSWGKGFPDGPVYRNNNGEKLDDDNYWLCAAFDEETGRHIRVTSKRTTLIDFNPALN